MNKVRPVAVAWFFFIPAISILFGQGKNIPSTCFTPDSQYYGVAEWNADSLGNHRAVLRVLKKSDAVWAHIPWRRRDMNPEQKETIVVDSTTGQRITNVHRANINREFGDILFQPRTVPGTYYVYFLPSISGGSRNYPRVTYRKPEQTASPQWLSKLTLSPEHPREKEFSLLPKARLVQFQSANPFDSFYPMEIISTAHETETLLALHPDAGYLLFPEDRSLPIRMTRDLPLKWIQEGVRHDFKGTAARNEFYAFQIGLYAARTDIQDIHIQFSDCIKMNGEESIPSSAFTCINTGGVDWTGKSFTKECMVKKGSVQPLWMGIQIPKDLVPGIYTGQVTVAPVNQKSQSIRLQLTVAETILEDEGDSAPWRHSRLRWLDSRIAENDDIVSPFTPMTIQGNTIGCLGRKVTLSESGFPRRIQTFFAPEMTLLTEKGVDILNGPVTFIFETASPKKLQWRHSGIQITKQSRGAIAWKSISEAGPFTLHTSAQMEFDGCIEYRICLAADQNVRMKDIRLEIPMVKDMARYMMGMGFKGGYRPSTFQWKWDSKKNQDGLWIGEVYGGLQCSFKDENYARPLNTNFYQSKPLNMPPSWYNEGKGGFCLAEPDSNTVLLIASSGPRSITTGDTLHFNFRLLLTPFKPIDTRAHWCNRYYHRYEPVDSIADKGANTINVHHATAVNTFINYPFLRPEAMKAYIDSAHAAGMKVKIYYTVRELSNKAPELFALRSLGDEILSHGPGGGFAWLQEHLDPDYIPGWLVPQWRDAAVITSGVSRWHNYYLEGLNWLVQNVGIDGLYIDDVAFDRTVMKRVRKILDRDREGSLIDLHSANQYNPRDGFASSANLYLEHFPFIHRLWFGEYFDYNSSPDFWLIEMSGIPFGIMGEMLQDSGNPWRGMIFGMTSRLPWAGDPRPIWKIWDDFSISESKMIGYWSPSCPVRTGNSDVLATVYVKEKEHLIALASWADKPVDVYLKIDWNATGMNPRQCILDAPFVKDFQEARRFQCDGNIPVEPGKGWLLILGKK
jgi:hypothetical protein